MKAAFLLALAPAAAKIVTINKVTSEEPKTLTTTVQPDAKTVDATTVDEVTLFHATTIPVTIATGTVVTTIGPSKPAPVTEQSSYSTGSLTAQANPSTYSQGFTIVKPSPPPSDTKTTSPASPPAASSAAGNGQGAAPPAGGPAGSSPAASSSEAAPSSGAPAAPSSPAPPSGGAYYPDGNIFNAVDTSEPLSMFPQKPLSLALPANVGIKGPIQTNKFFSNAFLNGQNLSMFAQPYAVWYANDQDYYGFGVSYTNSSQRVFGPDASSDPAEYYTNPLMLKAFSLSATEFSPGNFDFGVTDNSALSVTTTLSKGDGSITFPVSIGMGFVTAVYKGLTPRLWSQLGVIKLVQNDALSNGVQKYKAELTNGAQWNIYVTVPNNQQFVFKANSNFEIVGSSAIDGLIVQVGVIPDGATSDADLDRAAGAYPVSNSIDASVSGDVATYSINYDIKGSSTSGNTLLYALPHHVDSFDADTKNAQTGLTAYSRTKGWLKGVVANKLVMTEQLYTGLQWLPWQVDNEQNEISASALQLLAKTANTELSEDIKGQSNSASTYTAGKGLDKFAYITLVASEILGNDGLAKQGLQSLKDAISPWLSNQQQTPFIYDTTFKGVTSSATPDEDFGAPYYNDHHFHYGYYLHTAAVIGKLDQKYGDGQWVSQNKDWVNSLVRDVANPSTDDTHFPVFRMFDFFSGHSWAAGLFESGDGKNEESTSEDYNFAYGMKLWGQVAGDKSMEARGDLMLAIMKRTMPNYFLFEDDNNIQPKEVLANRVAGISFENKIDHTTFFGTNVEYIQGIQMLPMTGASGLVRPKTFAQQEWQSKLASVVDGLDSGWAGILRANQALFDPKSSYEWFASDSFKDSYLDGGASRTWCLAMAAALGGSS